MSTKNTDDNLDPTVSRSTDSAARRNVKVSEGTWTGIKVYAAAHGMRYGEVVELALSRFLSDNSPMKPGETARDVAERMKNRT